LATQDSATQDLATQDLATQDLATQDSGVLGWPAGDSSAGDSSTWDPAAEAPLVPLDYPVRLIPGLDHHLVPGLHKFFLAVLFCTLCFIEKFFFIVVRYLYFISLYVYKL
jgi:hypothetical protein